MLKWTSAELTFAIKIVTQHGYDFETCSRIMARNGYPFRSGSDIKDRIRSEAPETWAKITDVYDRRQVVKISGVAASSPKRRFTTMTDDFIEFISNMTPDLRDDQACWSARLAGFNCNITDIHLGAKRSGYQFSNPDNECVDYTKAIMDDLCVWPVGEGACGNAREKGEYCGPHHCRSLGRSG